VLYSLEGDFGFSAPNSDNPATEIGHEVKLINFNQLPDTPLALKVQRFAHNTPPFVQAFTQDNINGFNRTYLDIQPPQQHTRGCEFYQAIRAKGDQRQAVRGGTSPDRDRRLDQHPSRREPFEAESSADQIRSGYSGNGRHSLYFMGLLDALSSSSFRDF
jgi:hypothetical protein